MKRISIFVIVLLLGLTLAAKDIKVEGYGIDQAQAKSDAIANLSEFLNGAFVESSVFSSMKDGDKGYSSSLSSSTSTKTMGLVKAVEYTYFNRGNEIGCNAVIKDSKENINRFSSELSELDKTISALVRNLEKQTGDARKNTLVTLYSALLEYDSYSNILIYLGYPELVPVLSSPVSSTSVYTEYANIVIAEGYALEEKERFVTDETEHQKLLEALNENRKEQRRLEREKSEAIRVKEEASRKALAERLQQSAAVAGIEVPSAKTKTDQYDDRLAEVYTLRENFLSSCQEFNRLCEEQFYLIDKDYKAEKKAVEERPYRYAELQNGKPTSSAKNVRDQELEYLYFRKEFHKAAVLKQIRLSMLDPIHKRYNSYKDCLDALDGQSFSFVLGSSNISKAAVIFDAINTAWTVKLSIDGISGVKEPLTIKLSYKELTGKDVQEAKFIGQRGYDEYQAFLDDVDYLDSLMKDFSSNFRVTLRFSIDVTKCNSGIGYEGLNISQITMEVESNSIEGNEDFVIIKGASPSSIKDDSSLKWKLPTYAKSFDWEFE